MMKCFRNIRIMAAAILLWLSIDSKAQDIHFSQFYQSPFSLNPGLTGDFDGAYRLIGNQRTQWKSVTVPYSTWGLAADAANVSKKDIGIGLSFFNDKAGDSKLTTTMLNAFVSKKISIKNDPTHSLSLGLGLGFTSMSIDYSDLTYDNQWTGLINNPSLESGEAFSRDSRAYMNLHFGVVYSKKINDKARLRSGFSMFNLTSPKQSWFDQGFVRLNQRFNIHVNVDYKINDLWAVEPMLLFMSQGKFKEFDLGGRAHYVLESKPWMYRSIYGGIVGRTKDAGYILAGLRYDNWDIGISYDINTSNLKPASNGRGGFEVGVIYTIPPKPKLGEIRKVCPDYI